MKRKLSPAFTEQVKKKLPVLRKETETELAAWGEYIPHDAFYDDKKVIETIPFAVYEFLWLNKKMKMQRKTIIEWLNEGMFKNVLDKIICHTLRKLALKK
jgi:hypothetical protein